MAKRRRLLLALALLCIALIAWIAWGNTALEVTPYTVMSSQLPAKFSGFRIAQISDLHNTQIGGNNEKLLAMLADSQPDLIAITGDLIDSRNTNIQAALDFAAQAVQIAPCYYVTGNHESRIAEYDILKTGLEDLGVIVLENEALTLASGDASIVLAGVRDPSFSSSEYLEDEAPIMTQVLENFQFAQEDFVLLLSHKPELFPTYCDYPLDLVLTGNVHGGQFRIPYFGGLFAPSQSFFPEYDAGLYEDNGTVMLISRGIGNSVFPFRVNNPPEVLLITLQSA